MITFAKISSNVWRLVDYFDSVLIRDLKREDFEKLDRDILGWYETVPESIRINNLGNHIPVPGTSTYNVQRLQVWTRLRLNQVSRDHFRLDTFPHLWTKTSLDRFVYGSIHRSCILSRASNRMEIMLD